MPKTTVGAKGSFAKAAESRSKRVYLQQSMLPKRKLRDALVIPQAIVDDLGGKASAPNLVALALKTSPTSSSWRDLTGAAIAYGLTEGGYNSDEIKIADLGRRCTAPTSEGDDVAARNEASLRPQVLRQFFEKYDKSRFPADQIGKNVLQHEFAVPSDRVEEVLGIIKDNGAYVGVLQNTATGLFVALNNPDPSASISLETPERPAAETDLKSPSPVLPDLKAVAPSVTPKQAALDTFKVFISHSKNMDVVAQVKDVLGLYDIDFVLAVEEETTAVPVPDKVLDAMRRCQAGVMVVTADEQAVAGNDFTINNNCLIEIGAAFVLYNKRVVLLWDGRLKVPSNLSGLYRCDFEGSALSFAVGTKLAKAVKGFKQN